VEGIRCFTFKVQSSRFQSLRGKEPRKKEKGKREKGKEMGRLGDRAMGRVRYWRGWRCTFCFRVQEPRVKKKVKVVVIIVDAS
jgi:hypothetical protein